MAQSAGNLLLLSTKSSCTEATKEMRGGSATAVTAGQSRSDAAHDRLAEATGLSFDWPRRTGSYFGIEAGEVQARWHMREINHFLLQIDLQHGSEEPKAVLLLLTHVSDVCRTRAQKKQHKVKYKWHS